MSRLDLEFAESAEETTGRAEIPTGLESAAWLSPELTWLIVAAIGTVALVLIVTGY
jgi:hypothetical protein